MIASLRAVVAVAMIAGFYLLALGQLVAVIAFCYWLTTLVPGLLALKLVWPLLAAATGAVGLAFWRAIRDKASPPDGLPITPADAPHLWDSVRRLAAEVSTRAPDEVRIVPLVNAAVVEQSRLLGLLPGRRTLYLGMPLLHGLSVARLQAVIAHELGHYSGRHTRLGAVAYRSRLAIGGTIERIGKRNPVGWGFKAYAMLYMLVDHAVVRRQELEADRAAVWIVGRQATGSALREVHVIGTAWTFFMSRYVTAQWEAGYAPEDIFGGFRQLLAGRQEALQGLRLTMPQDEGSRWDTHPPLEERLEAIAIAPVRAVAVDDRPADILLPELDAIGRDLQAAWFGTGGRTTLSWPDLTAAAATAEAEQFSAPLLAAVHRAIGGTAPVTLGAILDLIESGRVADVAQPLFPTATHQELPDLLAHPLGHVIALATVRSDAGRWLHSWSGPAELLSPGDDEPIDLAGLSQLAVIPETVARARRRLGSLGVDLTVPLAPGVVRAAAPAGVAVPAGAGGVRVGLGGPSTMDQVLGGFASITVDGAPHDMFVLDAGLVLIAIGPTTGTGKARMNATLASMSLAELIETHKFIRYDEMVRAQIIKRNPINATIDMADGRQMIIVMGWTSPLLTKESDTLLLHLLATKPVTRPPDAPGAAGASGVADAGPGGPDLATATVMDGLANIAVDNIPYDLLVLDIGLVLIPDPGPSHEGKERLRWLVGNRSIAELAERNWLIRYEHIVGGQITKRIPIGAELELWDGRRITISEPWTTQELTDSARSVLTDALTSVGASTP